jgi:hypothetical protein
MTASFSCSSSSALLLLAFSGIDFSAGLAWLNGASRAVDFGNAVRHHDDLKKSAGVFVAGLAPF